MAPSAQPTSSQPNTPSKRKKKPDPFLDLANTPIPSAVSSPDEAQKDFDRSESTIKKVSALALSSSRRLLTFTGHLDAFALYLIHHLSLLRPAT